jgi:predicted transcriptional regulator
MPDPKHTAPITDAEELVMRELWKDSPLSAQEVASRLEAQTAWKLTTVKTLLNRLVVKGAVRATPRGKANDYSAALSEDAWVAAQSRSFLDRVFNGALTPMVAHFVEKRRISRADLDALKQLLAQAEAEQSPDKPHDKRERRS